MPSTIRREAVPYGDELEPWASYSRRGLSRHGGGRGRGARRFAPLLLWVATIRNADQIGQLSIGTLLVGVACAFAAVMLVLSMIRAIRRAEDGRALLAALLGGGFAIAAAEALAASDVLGKLAG